MNTTEEIDLNRINKVVDIVSIVVPIFFGLIAITGLVGNSLVIIVVLANAQMRSTTNLLIANLAVADLLFIVFCIPFTATDYALRIWPFGLYWCKIVQYLIVVTALTSIYTLVLMSLDRFLAVVYPINSKSFRTKRNTKIAIAILWTVVLTISLPIPFLYGLEEYKHANRHWISCRFLYGEESAIALPLYQITFMSCAYLLPLILISGLYIRMIGRLWRSVNRSSMSGKSHKSRRRVTRLVVIVVIAFAFLWFPIQVILVLKSLQLYESATPLTILLQIVSHILAYTSFCINPLLYSFLSENFRKAFNKVMCCSMKNQQYTCETSVIAARRTSHNEACSAVS